MLGKTEAGREGGGEMRWLMGIVVDQWYEWAETQDIAAWKSFAGYKVHGPKEFTTAYDYSKEQQ